MLFFKECKKVIYSLPFLLYVVLIIAMYVTQVVPEITIISAPQEGLFYYGEEEQEIPEILMPAATEGLISEYLSGCYSAYPFGFYKEIQLTQKKQEKIAEIIEKLTGLTKEELDSIPTKYQLSDITYEEFRELMKEADKIIGGGSRYSSRYLLSNFCKIPLTYEDALAEYEELMEGTNLMKAYARLYSDYMGIFLGIIPVFVCISLWQMDKRFGMEGLIYSRKISSLRLVSIRYQALLICLLLPLAVTFFHTLLRVNTLYAGRQSGLFAAIQNAVCWLVPELLLVSSVCVFLSEMFSPLFSIFIQGIWWFASLQATKLVGDIGKWSLLIRHNTIGKETVFSAHMKDFIWNRTMCVFVSIALIAVTVLIYKNKRRGKRYGII